jgi:hypothetical protein
VKSLFSSGFQAPKENFWMGRNSVYVATTPTDTATKETSWTDVFSQALTSGAKAYGSYSDIKVAQATGEATESEAAIKAAQANTAQIMQQTLALQQAALAKQNQIMGIDKSVFFIGAALLGLAVVGGAFYLMAKK